MISAHAPHPISLSVYYGDLCDPHLTLHRPLAGKMERLKRPLAAAVNGTTHPRSLGVTFPPFTCLRRSDNPSLMAECQGKTI
ncbi:hypothetical protein CEXT_323181 [Caerostris extrusa]|uniref:Uncharacterized protein n=1 Tax=Caerostris extrusa TaxID=172846 RepID=A0AAV4N1A6_CAEEX|nr:hypothetical protein CEXT_323181 [Caerostris extrusa]